MSAGQYAPMIVMAIGFTALALFAERASRRERRAVSDRRRAHRKARIVTGWRRP